MKARIPNNKSKWADQRLREIEKLMEHPLSADDTFSFRCKQCGKCCRNREDILLSPFDICRIAGQIGVKPEEVIDEYGFVYIGESSLIPLVGLKMNKETNACPFLKENRCSIQSGKPSVCALFPLGRVAARELDGDAKLRYILQPTSCGARDETHTPREWMAGFNLEESEQQFMVWQNVVMSISERLKSIVHKMPTVPKNVMYHQMHHFLYVCYQVEEPLIPQLERNKQLTDTLLDVVEDAIAEYEVST